MSFDGGRIGAELHARAFTLLSVLIGIHVSAIAFYAFHERDNLLEAMLRGDRAVPGLREPARMAPSWRALPGMLLAGAVVWLVAAVLGSA